MAGLTTRTMKVLEWVYGGPDAAPRDVIKQLSDIYDGVKHFADGDVEIQTVLTVCRMNDELKEIRKAFMPETKPAKPKEKKEPKTEEAEVK